MLKFEGYFFYINDVFCPFYVTEINCAEDIVSGHYLGKYEIITDPLSYCPKAHMNIPNGCGIFECSGFMDVSLEMLQDVAVMHGIDVGDELLKIIGYTSLKINTISKEGMELWNFLQNNFRMNLPYDKVYYMANKIYEINKDFT